MKTKELGFIARMNGKSRSPYHDPKMKYVLLEEDPVSLYADWLQGWDECNREYAKVEQANRKTDKTNQSNI